MFKFETIVYVALVTFFCSQASAQNNNNNNNYGGGGRSAGAEAMSQCADFSREANRLEIEKNNLPETASDQQRTVLDNKIRSAKKSAKDCKDEAAKIDSKNSCTDANAEYTKASGAFVGACKAAKLPAEDKRPGSIGCSWSINRCLCLNKKISDEDEEKYECNSGSNTKKSTNTIEGMIDMNNVRRREEFCPQAGKDDAERYEKQLEKSQERKKELGKKIPELLTKGSEAQDKATQAQNDASKKASDAQEKFANELKEIKRKKESDEQQAVAEMAQGREKMDQLDSTILQYETSKIDAEVKLAETKTALELQCHSQASKMVSDRQAAKLASIRAGQPTGDFNKMMNSVGVSTRDQWEKQAAVYYRRCIDSRPTRESKKSATNTYESTIRQVNNAIATARKQRASVAESLSQVMTNRGCGAAPMQANGMTGESKMCRSLRQAQEDMNQAYQNQRQVQAQLQNEANAAQRTLAQKNQALNTEYQEAVRELGEETARMANLRDYLNFKRENEGGAPTKDADSVNTALGKMDGAAKNLDFCCKNDPERFSNNENCSIVRKYIEENNGDRSLQHDNPADRTDPAPALRTETERRRPAPAPGATPQNGSGGSGSTNGP